MLISIMSMTLRIGLRNLKAKLPNQRVQIGKAVLARVLQRQKRRNRTCKKLLSLQSICSPKGVQTVWKRFTSFGSMHRVWMELGRADALLLEGQRMPS